MPRRVAALALIAVAVASAALIYPRLRRGRTVEFEFKPQPWMDVVPTSWDPTTALCLGEWAEVPRLAEHLGGSTIQLLGVRSASLSPKDVRVLVLPPDGCLADCDSPIPTRAAVYILENRSAVRLYKAMAVSGTLRYRDSGFTVFFAVGRTPDGRRDRDYASLAAFRDELMILVWGQPKRAKAALESLLALPEDERMFGDEGVKKAFALASSGLRTLKVVVGSGSSLRLGARKVVIALGVEEGGDRFFLRVSAVAEGMSELDPDALRLAASNLTSLQGVNLTSSGSYSGDGVTMVEFEVPGEQLEEVLGRL